MADEPMVPGVYIEETSGAARSIFERPTSIPAFVGHTARDQAATPLHQAPTRISSLLEYEQLFGGAAPEPVRVMLVTDRLQPAGVMVTSVTPASVVPAFCLYWAVRHYFDNGGAECVIVSAGGYGSAPDAESLTAGVKASASDPDVTLLVVPEAATLRAWSSFAAVTSAMLLHSSTHQGRFAILDVWRGDAGPSDGVNVPDAGPGATTMTVVEASRRAWTDGLAHGAAYYPFLRTAYPRFQFVPDAAVAIDLDGRPAGTLDELRAVNQAASSLVRNTLADVRVSLPPSGAVTGVYAQMDRTRGVWKAPANVSLNATIGPLVPLVDAQQTSLNTDVEGGKSINAIRSFPGKGTLVWGARTLLGHSNEWRYVSVRRLADSIERSIYASTQWVVFEPNDATTWTRLAAMVEDYLLVLWRNGALLGAKSDEAFWVRCGLGQTMTSDDVRNGRVRLSIGLAMTRPAEFQLLGLSYSVQPV